MTKKLIPAGTFVSDVVQFTLAPWFTTIPWPAAVGHRLKVLAEVAYFTADSSLRHLAWHVALHAIFVAVFLSAIMVLAPPQHVLKVLGPCFGPYAFLWLQALFTLFSLPILRTLFGTFHCHDGDFGRDEAHPCLGSVHFYEVVMSVLSVLALVAGSIAWQRSFFSRHELAKRRFNGVGPWDTRTATFPATMLICKLVLAGIMGLLQHWMPPIAVAVGMLAATSVVFGTLLCSMPFVNRRTQSLTLAVYAMPTWTAFMAFVVAVVAFAGEQRAAKQTATEAVAWMCVILWLTMVPALIPAVYFCSSTYETYKSCKEVDKSFTIDGAPVSSPRLQRMWTGLHRERRRTATSAIAGSASTAGTGTDEATGIADCVPQSMAGVDIGAHGPSDSSGDDDDLHGGHSGGSGAIEVDLAHELIGASTQTFWHVNQRIASASNTKLLNLSDNDLQPAVARGILGSVITNTSSRLCQLNLSGNTTLFSRSTTCGLSALLAAPCSTLRELNLSGCRIHPQALNGICLAASAGQRTLRVVELRNCGLSGALAGRALNSLLQTRRTGSGESVSQIEQLDLSSNPLGPDGLGAMVEGLRDAQALRHLDLSWTGLGVAGARLALAAVVQQARKGLQIKVHSNGVGRRDLAGILAQWEVEKRARRQAAVEAGSMSVEQASEAARLDQEGKLEDILRGKSIFEFIGGMPAVKAVVDTFYLYLVTDPALSKYFKNIAMGRMRHLQATFFAKLLGGPDNYRGQGMAAGHAHLQLGHDVFDHTVELLLRAVLEHLPDAPKPLLSALLEAVGSFRSHIVGKPTAPVAPADAASTPRRQSSHPRLESPVQVRRGRGSPHMEAGVVSHAVVRSPSRAPDGFADGGQDDDEQEAEEVLTAPWAAAAALDSQV